MSVFVSVLYDFDGTQVENGLTCVAGSVLQLIEDCGEWMWVSEDGVEGFVPTNYVEIIKRKPKPVYTKQQSNVSYVSSSYSQKSSNSKTSSVQDPELSRMLQRKKQVADMEVNSHIDEDSLRRGISDTLHSNYAYSSTEGVLASCPKSEEKKEYGFKRDPQLDDVLKRKQLMIEKKENQEDQFNKQEEKHFEFKRNAELDAVLKRKQLMIEKKENQNDEFNKQEEKHFEFKRNAELDAVLKRKHKVATKEVGDGDENAIRNSQKSLGVLQPRRTKEEIMQEVEASKNDFYYDRQSMSPFLPNSKPVRYSMLQGEGDPVLSLNPKVPLVFRSAVTNRIGTPKTVVCMDKISEGPAESVRESGRSVSASKLSSQGYENEPFAPSASPFNSTCVVESEQQESFRMDGLQQSSRRTFMVDYDFERREEQEISVYAGEIVTCISEAGEWCLIQTDSGEEGFVPMGYLHEIQMNGRQVRILYDFYGNDDNQISVLRDEIITVFQDSGEWMEGETQDGHVGWFPSSFAVYL